MRRPLSLRIARRLLPGAVRSALYDPAAGDLQMAHATACARPIGVARRIWCHVALACRVALLVVDCWRVAAIEAVRGDLPPSTSSGTRTTARAIVLDRLRQARRMLVRESGFTATAVLILALGIGAVVTVFSVFNALLIRPLPYRQPQQLVAVWPNQALANREIDAIRTRSRSYADVAAFSPGWLMTLTGVPVARQVDAARVSSNFFSMLGVEPLIGRTFDPDAETPGRDAVVVLSEPLWETVFNSDSAILGRSIQLNGSSYVVQGVMPRSFRLLHGAADAWTPLTMDRSAMTWAGSTALAVARLAPRTTAAEASAELRGLLEQMETGFQHSDTWPATSSVIPLQELIVGDTRSTLIVLLLAVVSLLLLAVANVGNLLLIRIAERRSELAVRSALGATPRQIRVLLLTESALLSLIGTALGTGLAYAAVSALRRLLPSDLPRLDEIAIDAHVMAAVVGVMVLVTVGFSIVPAWQDLGGAGMRHLRSMRTQTRRGRRSRGALVSFEVAFAVILMVGATLMARTLIALNHVDRGLRSDHVLTMRLQPPGSDAELRAYWTDVLARVEAVPGVLSAATILHLPMSGRNWQADIVVEGRTVPAGTAPPRAGWQSVSAKYFATAGVPIIAGRAFDPTDGPDGPLVVAINAALAERLFPGENPIGRRISAGNATAKQMAAIVSVVGTVRHGSLRESPVSEVYVPFAQQSVGANSLIVRTATPPLSVAAAIEACIRQVNHDVPISDVKTMDALYASSLDRPRLISVVLGSFAGVGVLLAAVGIYGVVAYGVRQRQREIGIRVALGASAWTVRRLIVREGVGNAVLGLAVGIPGAVLLARSMQGLLFGVPAADVWSFGIVLVTVLAVATVASGAPAWRSSAGDPTDVLRA